MSSAKIEFASSSPKFTFSLYYVVHELIEGHGETVTNQEKTLLQKNISTTRVRGCLTWCCPSCPNPQLSVRAEVSAWHRGSPLPSGSCLHLSGHRRESCPVGWATRLQWKKLSGFQLCTGISSANWLISPKRTLGRLVTQEGWLWHYNMVATGWH